MLKNLIIKNVALIDEVRINFSEGFNALTGETGAGKSILIDAISLLLGNKADKTIIKNGENFAKVEAFFSLDEKSSVVEEVLSNLDIEYDGLINLSRLYHDTGKSEYRINGELCTLNLFKKVSHCLIDIFGQHDNQQLMDKDNHVLFYDQFIGECLTIKQDELCAKLEDLASINRNISVLGGDSSQRAREIDLLQYEIKQLEDANIKPNEDEDLLNRKRLLINSEKLHTAISSAIDFLSNHTDVCGILKNASSSIVSMSGIDKELDDLKSRIDSVRWELDDVIAVLENKLNAIEYSEDELNKIEDRLDVINTFKRKFGNSIEDILGYYENAKSRLIMLQNCDEKIEELNSLKKDKLMEVLNIAKEIHQIRIENIQNFENAIRSELVELGMKNARFKVSVEYEDSIENIEKNINKYGLDKIEFLFSANLGQEVKPLDMIISGGELSRFCLAFKAIINVQGKNKTLIFDEIDTGIGGNTGSAVAKKIAKISRKNQVLCITHLAQIAAFADSHFKILKTEDNENTTTSVSCLDMEERKDEIGRMIGSIEDSSFAYMHSNSLIAEASAYKEFLN